MRTLLPPLASFPSLHEDAAGGLDAAWSKLVEWSIVAYEAFLDGEDAEQSAVAEQPTLSSSASPSTQHDPATAPSLAPFFLFSTLSPLLHALDALPRTLAAPPSATASTATHLSPLGVPPLPRGALLPGHAQRDAPRAGASAIPPEAELYLADAVARVVLFAHGAVALGRGELGEVVRKRSREAGLGQRRGRGRGEREGEGAAGETAEGVWRVAVEARLSALERVGIDTLAGGGEQGAALSAVAPRPAEVMRDDPHAARLARVEAQNEALQTALTRQERGPIAAEPVVARAEQQEARGGRERERERVRTDVGVLLAIFVLGLATGVGLVLQLK